MQFVEGPVEAITLNNFAEVTAATGAVLWTKGEEHPLVKPTRAIYNGLGTSLFDELYRPEDQPPKKFEGQDATAIIQSLKKIAEHGSDSPHQIIARRMLDETFGGHTQSNSLQQPAEPVKTYEPAISPVAIKPSIQPVPPSVNGEIVDGHVELRDIEERLTALRSVHEFADEKGRAIIPRLERDLMKVNLSKPESVIYWGEEARVIYNALHQAADRRSELHDASAAHMLGVGKSDDSTPQTASADKTSEPVAA